MKRSVLFGGLRLLDPTYFELLLIIQEMSFSRLVLLVPEGNKLFPTNI